jgi:hypothetical protein
VNLLILCRSIEAAPSHTAHAESGAVGRETGGRFDAGGVEGVGDETEGMFSVLRGCKANII